MIKATVQGIVYDKIPTKWNELTYKQYVLLNSAEEEKEILSILSGIPIAVINKTDESQLSKLTMLFGFIQFPENPEEHETPKEINVGGKKIPFVTDIKEKTFGQKIYLQNVTQEYNDKIITALPEIVAIYSQEYIDNSEFDLNRIEEIKLLLEDVFFVDLYSTAISYIEQLKDILEEESKTLGTEPDNNQVEAGVGMFERFGALNTIKALAQNDVTKYDEVVKIEYNVVFRWMDMNKVQNIFNENYRKVLEQNAKNKK